MNFVFFGKPPLTQISILGIFSEIHIFSGYFSRKSAGEEETQLNLPILQIILARYNLNLTLNHQN